MARWAWWPVEALKAATMGALALLYVLFAGFGWWESIQIVVGVVVFNIFLNFSVDRLVDWWFDRRRDRAARADVERADRDNT